MLTLHEQSAKSGSQWELYSIFGKSLSLFPFPLVSDAPAQFSETRHGTNTEVEMAQVLCAHVRVPPHRVTY
jgi:hypothetical protein